MNDIERRSLIRDIQHEMLGFGPLEVLLNDPDVSDIMINGAKQIYIEKNGKLALSDVTFTSASTVEGFARSLPGLDFSTLTGVCIGASTAAAARSG